MHLATGYNVPYRLSLSSRLGHWKYKLDYSYRAITASDNLTVKLLLRGSRKLQGSRSFSWTMQGHSCGTKLRISADCPLHNVNYSETQGVTHIKLICINHDIELVKLVERQFSWYTQFLQRKVKLASFVSLSCCIPDWIGLFTVRGNAACIWTDDPFCSSQHLDWLRPYMIAQFTPFRLQCRDALSMVVKYRKDISSLSNHLINRSGVPLASVSSG